MVPDRWTARRRGVSLLNLEPTSRSAFADGADAAALRRVQARNALTISTLALSNSIHFGAWEPLAERARRRGYRFAPGPRTSLRRTADAIKPRRSSSRTAAARLGILVLNRKSSIAASSSPGKTTCSRSVRSCWAADIAPPVLIPAPATHLMRDAFRLTSVARRHSGSRCSPSVRAGSHASTSEAARYRGCEAHRRFHQN